MKLPICLFFVIISLSASAQKLQKFYDYNWRECDASEARFVAVIVKTDIGWHRSDYFLHSKKLQMDGTYKDEACIISQGKFYYYHSNGMIESTGNYINGNKDGMWLSFHNNGIMSDSTVYKNGKAIGISLGWHYNGYLQDSSFKNEDGSGVAISWFDNGSISFACRYSAGEKLNGKWQFFHKNGRMSALETYANGTITNKQYFTDAGDFIADTSSKDCNAEFIGGLRAWQKYLTRDLYFPEQYQIVNADKAVVVVSFIVDEEGKVTEVFAHTPFHPDFDKIAMRQIQNSPKWKPAVSHNRKIKYRLRQPVVFSQE